MNINSKLVLVAMLVMMIACVSAVSATDIDGTNDVSDDIVIDEVTDIVEDGEIDDVDEDIVGEYSQSETNPITVDASTYSNYFDANGYFNDPTVDEVTFDGSFGAQTYGNFKFNQSIVITATSGSTFTDVGFDLLANGIDSSLNQPVDDLSISDLDDEKDVVDIIESSNGGYKIWVDGTNENDGNGSQSNPFKSFDLACDDVNKEGKDKVTINVLDGEYSIGSYLTFNTTNLTIVGCGSNVIIKDVVTDNKNDGGFKLLTDSGYFSISNVTIAPKGPVGSTTVSSFYIFSGLTNLATFNNCVFDGSSFKSNNNKAMQIQSNQNTVLFGDYVYNDCVFNDINFQYVHRITNATFNYCIMNNPGFTTTSSAKNFKGYLTFNHCFINPKLTVFSSDNTKNNVKLNSYVAFQLDANYLGLNSFEIVGKLVNDDGTYDGIEKFPSMNVTLKSFADVIVNRTSNDGSGVTYLEHDATHYQKKNIQNTVTLENGLFKVKYDDTFNISDLNIPDSPMARFVEVANHVIIEATALSVTTSFSIVRYNINVSSAEISYGDDQNINITFLEVPNGILIVEIDNNKTYNTTINANNENIIYCIPDTLSAGTHNITVSFFDTLNNKYYAYNTTTLTVSKVSEYEFNATITPTTLYIGENASVTLNLPEGANGTVTVKVGENEAKTFNTNDNIIIDGFVEGDNIVNITFTSDNYETKSVVKTVVASIKPTINTAINISSTEKGIIIINLTDIDGNPIPNLDVKYNVGGENTTVTANDQGIVIVSGLTGEGELKAYFEGYENYLKSERSFKYNFTETTQNPNGTSTNSTGNATSGKGTSTNTGKTNTNTNKQTTTKKVTKKATKITAKKATFKAKKKTKKYTIVLKAGKSAVKKVKVTIKIGKKTYKATTNNKGRATFKITKLTKKGKYTAVIKFAGNKNYKAYSKKVKITVKK